LALGAARTLQPALAKFYDSLSDEQKARLQSASFGIPTCRVKTIIPVWQPPTPAITPFYRKG
jgi:hypothetical protein